MHTKSLVCLIGRHEDNKIQAIEEAERYAKQEGLLRKKALHMRLITEELLGMVHSLVDIDLGHFWIEHTENGYEYHLDIRAKVAENVRKIFVGAATDKKNQAYRGVTGVVRKAMDEMFKTLEPGMDAALLHSHAAYVSDVSYSYTMHFNKMCEWSYKHYKKEMQKQGEAELWDELELSVLERLAEDIIVYVRPDEVVITIKAKKQ